MVIMLIYFDFVGKLNGYVVWVFLLNVLLIDCVFEVNCDIIVDEVNILFEIVVNGELNGILGYEFWLLVSSDYINDL